MNEFTSNKWRLGDRVIRDNFVFTGNNGIKVDIPENPSPLDFIAIFLTYDFFETVTHQTNLYTTSYLTSHRISPHSRFRKWPADGIPIEDMKCFFSLLISMGLLHQEDIQDYWSKDDEEKFYERWCFTYTFFPFCYAMRSFPEYTFIFPFVWQW